MSNRYLIIDVASAPIPGAAEFVEPVSAPKNYTDPAKIAAYVAEKTAERVANTGLDLDLARLTGIGIVDGGREQITLCRDHHAEQRVLEYLANELKAGPSLRLITYNGFAFDLPLIMRRARYLGVDFPKINLDRYRSPHVDLMLELTDRDPNRRRPLGFYVRRMGWRDLVKPLDGAEESRVHQTGQWDELEQSIRHDVIAAHRLARWMGVIAMEPVAA